MSNWVDYELDVLAQSPEELERVIARLQQPSADLVDLVERTEAALHTVTQLETDFDEGYILTLDATKADQDAGKSMAEWLKELVRFKTAERFYSQGTTKSCRLKLACKDHSAGIVRRHLFEVSAAFPDVILLLLYYDMMASYAGKVVIKSGELFQQIHDGPQQAQAMDWVLIDIFAPFKTEYELGTEFGSLWQQWLADLTLAVKELKESKDEPQAAESSSAA